MTILFHTHDRPTSLHNVEGLSAFLSRKFTRPDKLTDAQYAELTDSARAQYDRERIIYASGGIVIPTPHVLEAWKLMEQAFGVNLAKNSGHAGLMLSGDSTIGKTETTKALMRKLYSQYIAMFPDFADSDRIPVVYVSVPASSTGKLLMKTFADFLGLPVTGRESMGEIRSRVVQALTAAGTQLIVVDELHNLVGRSVGLGESVDVLKELHNELPATFVYAGIGLPTSALLSGPKGRQLRGRFTILDMDRLNLSDPADAKTWRQIINAFEKQLPLRHQKLGTLKSLSSYLFLRTSGSIGSLAKLLTGSTIELITNSDYTVETLTEELMDTIKLDQFAEENYKIKKASLSPRKTTQYPLAGLDAA
ncbi:MULTISPECIES: TniB family NTP-binding protein [unclassified Cryobacterium]|uniref:TniB family NTP-binding protein n=1 Tax=unclassified Cryobacterium TaxID=2649013 RepID=UPI000CE3CCE2|nr:MULTISPECIES: TniB family NTP-binding protein [unclassified Cryobacterium]